MPRNELTCRFCGWLIEEGQTHTEEKYTYIGTWLEKFCIDYPASHIDDVEAPIKYDFQKLIQTTPEDLV